MFGLFFAASRGSAILRVLFFWIPTVVVSALGFSIVAMYAYPHHKFLGISDVCSKPPLHPQTGLTCFKLGPFDSNFDIFGSPCLPWWNEPVSGRGVAPR